MTGCSLPQILAHVTPPVRAARIEGVQLRLNQLQIEHPYP